MAEPATKTTPQEDDETGEAPPSAAPKRTSVLVLLAAMVALTALGAGSGGLLGLHLKGKMEESAARAKTAEVAAPDVKGAYPAGVALKQLTPVVTNLASPEHTWIRLEAALVMQDDQSPDAKVLPAQIAEDIVAFLRTVPLSQVQGPSGFQNLREDLKDRVRVRSNGKVQDLVIQALIIE